MELESKSAEAITISMKVLGAILAVISFRWVAKIFAGEDGKFSVTEFGRFTGFWFFLVAGAYMIYKDGDRSHEWPLYSEWYLAIVFGSLLSVLHLNQALERIVKIIEAIGRIRKGSPVEDPKKEEDK